MELAAVSAPHRIDIDMTFWRGNSATRSKSVFVLEGTGDVTEVHWTFDEERSFRPDDDEHVPRRIAEAQGARREGLTP